MSTFVLNNVSIPVLTDLINNYQACFASLEASELP